MEFDPNRIFGTNFPIDACNALAPNLFTELYLSRRVPVLIRGEMGAWPAMNWTNRYLRDKIGDQKVRISVAQNGMHFDSKRVLTYRLMNFDEFIAKIEDPDSQTERLYAAQLRIPKDLPQLAGDVRLPRYVENLRRTDEPNLWFGPGGNVTPLHYDQSDNFLTQIRGQKTVLLFPPAEIKNLYPHHFLSTVRNISRINITRPDAAAFPKIKLASFATVHLTPGDMLFIPSYWWHAVFGYEQNLSMNFWWAKPGDEWQRNPRQTIRGYLPPANLPIVALRNLRFFI